MNYGGAALSSQSVYQCSMPPCGVAPPFLTLTQEVRLNERNTDGSYK